VASGRKVQPSGAILDSQSINVTKTTEKGAWKLPSGKCAVHGVAGVQGRARKSDPPFREASHGARAFPRLSANQGQPRLSPKIMSLFHLSQRQNAAACYLEPVFTAAYELDHRLCLVVPKLFIRVI
jgi:hypothetical protein